jgi:glycerophosphoryl diester phosphodiesterase
MCAARLNRSDFDLQGHRGARGLLPENSIPAFLLAFDLGVTTLEMDTVINADGAVVVSHDPWMSAAICSHPDGRAVLETEQADLRIYAMSGAEMAGFDCGKRGHRDFPRQRPLPVTKPLLRDVFAEVASHAARPGGKRRGGPVRYNIEIKSRPEHDDRFHPRVERFASLLYAVVNEFGQVENTTVQSFDPRALEAVHRIDPQISTSLIVDNTGGLQTNLARLGFTPAIYSPQFALLDRRQTDAAHALGIRVIPWTVNDVDDMRKLIGMGVDGLITDYPDIAMNLLEGL